MSGSERRDVDSSRAISSSRAQRGVRPQRLVTALQHLTEYLVVAAKLLPHSPPLRTHSSERKGELAAVARCNRRGIERLDRVGTRVGHDRETIRVMRTAMCRGGGDVSERRSLRFAEQRDVADPRELGERLGAARTERQNRNTDGAWVTCSTRRSRSASA